MTQATNGNAAKMTLEDRVAQLELRLDAMEAQAITHENLIADAQQIDRTMERALAAMPAPSDDDRMATRGELKAIDDRLVTAEAEILSLQGYVDLLQDQAS